MAAVIRPQSLRHEQVRRNPARHEAPVRRPHLRVIEGGRSANRAAPSRPVASRYVRRRVVAAVLVTVAALAGLRGAAVLVSGLVAGTAGPGDTVVATTTHRAAAGDTLWGIAGRYAPSLDRRVAMDDLLAINGGGALQVGQEVRLPASWF